ncbi:hypothetical protein ACP3WD_24120, partial [Salmonella enterica]|uniref:hypothetical protein n=1 Tax=Salmonella enterica TaxID=28901 RepID=UPI003CF47E4C
LVEVKNESATTALPAVDHASRNILLLQKKGDKRRLENKRPIALLNCDARLLATADVIRLKKHIGTLVGDSQVGFMPKRWIGDNIANIQA